MSYRVALVILSCLLPLGSRAESGASPEIKLAVEARVQGREVHYRVDLAGRDAGVRDLRVVVELPRGLGYWPGGARAAVPTERTGGRLVFFLDLEVEGDWFRNLEFEARPTASAVLRTRVVTKAFATFVTAQGETLQTPVARTITYGDSQGASGIQAANLPPRREGRFGRLRKAEVGGFTFDSNRGEPDWGGQRLLVQGNLGESTTAQLELLGTRRRSENGQVGSLAVWQDLGSRFFAFAGATVADDDAPFARRRGDIALHWKLPVFEGLTLSAGAGRAEFDDGRARMWTGGSTYYFDPFGGGSLSYNFTYSDNDLDSSALRGVSGIGRSHLVALQVGQEENRSGQLRIHYLSATDALSDFVIASGKNETFSSHSAAFAWRKRWTRHFGSHLQFDWEKRRDLFYRKGADVRLIYYF